MKRDNGQVLAILILVITTAALLGSGCAKKAIIAEGSPLRYQVVQIPGYEPEDYLAQLEAGDEAVRCNALCNLIPHAGEYGELLSRPRPDEAQKPTQTVDEQALRTARRVYEKVKASMGGERDACQAAAMIFIAEFAATYSKPQEIVDLVLSVKTTDARIRFEQLNVLGTIQRRPHPLDATVLEPFLDSPAWMVRAMTCRLLAQMPCDPLHPRLIQAYDHSKLESDRILIIQAFGNGYGGDVFALLQREIQQSGNQRVKGAWAGILKAHRDQVAVRRWLFGQQPAIDTASMESVLAAYYGELNSPEGQRFFQELILSRQPLWVEVLDLERFFQGFYNAFTDGERTEALTGLQAAVMGNDFLQEQWREYRARYDQAAQAQEAREERDEQFTQRILPKFNLLLENFLKESEALFLDEGLDAQEAAEATREIRQFLELLREEPTQESPAQ